MLGQGIHHSRYDFYDYNGGLENWDICAVGKNVAIANEQGLIISNKGKWKINHTQSDISPKAVYYLNNKLYTAFGNRLGYFKVQGDTIFGNFVQISTPIIDEFELVWKIVSRSGKLYFQTDKNILVIENDKLVQTLHFHGFIRCVFEINKDIYFVDTKKGLLKNFVPIPNGDQLAGKEINVILPFSNGDLLISDASNKKFWRYHNSTLTPIWENNEIIKAYPFCGTKKDGNFIIGTTENGLYELDENGKTIQHYYSGNYLKHNKIFAVKHDVNDFLWIGLENGLECFRYDLPYTNLNFDSKNGNAINIEMIDTTVYFLTSTGIYFLNHKDLHNTYKNQHLKPWNGVIEPTYFIKKVKNTLVYGTNFGLMQVKNNQISCLDTLPNCNEFKKINEKYFIIKSNSIWYLYAIENGNISQVEKTKLPKDIQVMEGKIIWCAGNKLYQRTFDNNIKFNANTFYSTKENIERCFIKNDTLFITNSKGTFYVKGINKKELNIAHYSNYKIYEFEKDKTNIDPISINRAVFYDSNTKNKKQLSNLIEKILAINSDKLSFIKQINDTLFCLGSYKGFTIINSKMIDETNKIKFDFQSITMIKDNKSYSYKNLLHGAFWGPIDRLEIKISVDKLVDPQTPHFRLVIKHNNNIEYTSWQTDYNLELKHLSTGDYDIEIECKDWFGNIESIKIGVFTINKEYHFLFLFKLSILLAILMVIGLTIRKFFIKNRNLPKEISKNSAVN